MNRPPILPIPSSPSSAPLLELRDASKLYANGTLANDRIDLSIHAGELHAIIGENGAGKSTVLKLLYGLEQPSSGNLYLQGAPLTLADPAAAITAGIGLVPQHVQLLPSLTVAENIVLGCEPMRGWRLDRASALRQVTELMQTFGLEAPAQARVASLSLGMQQRVGILKALYRDARVLLLDEPSAVLAGQEARTLFQALRAMVARGLAVVLITHKLDEVLDFADRYTVLRRGRVSGSGLACDATPERLSELIVGGRPPAAPTRAIAHPDRPRLRVRSLHTPHPDPRQTLGPLSLDIGAGEILGIAGIEGNGQHLLAQALLGLRPAATGQESLDECSLTGLEVRARRDAGIAAIAEDRLYDGVAPAMSIADNLIALSYHRPPLSHRGRLEQAAIRAAGADMLTRSGVDAALDAPIATLSGGNMQKLLLTREIAAAPRLLIACQPTRGVDIGAARQLHRQLLALRAEGAALLLISSDLDELLALSDRIAVMAAGRITAHFSAVGLSADLLGPYLSAARRDEHASAALNAPFTLAHSEATQ